MRDRTAADRVPVELDSDPRRLVQDDPAVIYRERVSDELLEAVDLFSGREVLDGEAGGSRTCELGVEVRVPVRSDGYAVRLGKCGDPPPFADPARDACIGLENVRGASSNEVRESP